MEVDTRPGTSGPAELLRAAEQGDRVAWRELVARHTHTVWAVARAHGLDRSDAGDVVQNTWLSLLENMNGIHDPDRLAAWLATTARRHALRLLAARRRETPVDEARLDVAPAEAADAVVLRDTVNASLWRAFTQLSDHCQRVLRVLVHAPELSYQQVAAALGIPIGSIGPTRGRCLAELRRKAALAGLFREDAR
ncbi:RNA polymerase sigma factor [Kutzneria kofuensis]|uniref:RNA polymerase sigma factor (Sigma-70 family) n=1 Tax=Kutzneria kofuensis TaxID=103725 RepID=A0A7W9KJK4_9PSEU|nr:sigma-70 family RNA polymerase sigma factor [Kutzneria kofuensis]MBB5893029.1 RNA polymerase sigma factor (sigma-70 family) [Kutzneria kofuensis]